jgi:hypothetical protein
MDQFGRSVDLVVYGPLIGLPHAGHLSLDRGSSGQPHIEYGGAEARARLCRSAVRVERRFGAPVKRVRVPLNSRSYQRGAPPPRCR